MASHHVIDFVFPATVTEYGVIAAVIRHGDLIRHPIDGDLHPLGGVKRPVRGDDPFAGLIAC